MVPRKIALSQCGQSLSWGMRRRLLALMELPVTEFLRRSCHFMTCAPVYPADGPRSIIRENAALRVPAGFLLPCCRHILLLRSRRGGRAGHAEGLDGNRLPVLSNLDNSPLELKHGPRLPGVLVHQRGQLADLYLG